MSKEKKWSTTKVVLSLLAVLVILLGIMTILST